MKFKKFALYLLAGIAVATLLYVGIKLIKAAAAESRAVAQAISTSEPDRSEDLQPVQPTPTPKVLEETLNPVRIVSEPDARAAIWHLHFTFIRDEYRRSIGFSDGVSKINLETCQSMATNLYHFHQTDADPSRPSHYRVACINMKTGKVIPIDFPIVK